MPTDNPPNPPAPGPAASSGLPAPLAEAFTDRTPGPPLPPGPRANLWTRAGAESVPVLGPERDLLDGLWRSPGFHRRADGRPTSIRQRPVPSAGGTYPVHTHVVVGTGNRTLSPGRYAYNREDGTLQRRDESRDARAGWESSWPIAHTTSIHVVLTVQPGRTFGRYRHRSWPLWVADTAYALAAVEFLSATEPVAVRLGPGPWLRELLGVPRAAERQRWLDRGLAPEIPLAAIELPPDWQIAPDRRDALAVRRSPPVGEFEKATGTRLNGAAQVALASGQSWVLGAHRIRTWSISTRATPAEFADVLWRSHRTAAAQCYWATLSGWRSRPVSGFVAAHGRWTVHALAMLPEGDDSGRETGT